MSQVSSTRTSSRRRHPQAAGAAATVSVAMRRSSLRSLLMESLEDRRMLAVTWGHVEPLGEFDLPVGYPGTHWCPGQFVFG